MEPGPDMKDGYRKPTPEEIAKWGPFADLVEAVYDNGEFLGPNPRDAKHALEIGKRIKEMAKYLQEIEPSTSPSFFSFFDAHYLMEFIYPYEHNTLT